MNYDDKMDLLADAERDRLWREAEAALGLIVQVSLLGPKNDVEVSLVKACCSLVAAEIIGRVRQREKEEQS